MVEAKGHPTMRRQGNVITTIGITITRKSMTVGIITTEITITIGFYFLRKKSSGHGCCLHSMENVTDRLERAHKMLFTLATE
jgi:ascorbate-specific PTS system EIIC-type component UlaA